LNFLTTAIINSGLTHYTRLDTKQSLPRLFALHDPEGEGTPSFKMSGTIYAALKSHKSYPLTCLHF